MLNIYGYYVKNTAITYEYEIPTLEEFQNIILNTLKRYTYLVAELNGEIIGYVYAGQFQSRPGYAWDAEMTIYLRHDMRGKKVGEKLYTLLGRILYEQGVVKVIALITPTKQSRTIQFITVCIFMRKWDTALQDVLKTAGISLISGMT